MKSFGSSTLYTIVLFLFVSTISLSNVEGQSCSPASSSFPIGGLCINPNVQCVPLLPVDTASIAGVITTVGLPLGTCSVTSDLTMSLAGGATSCAVAFNVCLGGTVVQEPEEAGGESEEAGGESR